MRESYLSNLELKYLAKEKEVILWMENSKKQISGKIVEDFDRYCFIYREDKNTIADIEIYKEDFRLLFNNIILAKTDCLPAFLHSQNKLGNYKEYNKILNE